MNNSATGEGGGIYCTGTSDPVVLTVHGSLLSGNSGSSGADIAIAANCTIQGDHSLVSSAAGSGLTDGQDGNVVGVAVAVGSPADNGGLTPTVVPDPGAASIDMIPAAACTGPDGNALAEDQRGEPRPAGDGCDAGSVEQ